MHLYGTSQVGENGHLYIGGVDTMELASQYGTPLYVYDVALIRERARGFIDTFHQAGVKAQVAYASKAFSSVAIIQVMQQEGLSLDVVSGGELHTALTAGFPAEKIHFHGNNKSITELEMALDAHIGCFVVDNQLELQRLMRLGELRGEVIPVMLRVTPGIEAHTHDYILTGQEDSKFGFDLTNGQADEALRQAAAHVHIHVLGIHSHIGSQIFETTGFLVAIEKMMVKMARWQEEGIQLSVLNVGGGFGIRYTDEDDPLEPAQYVEAIIRVVKEKSAEYGLAVPEIWIEPGRSLVGDAGTTLYTVGSRKTVPNVREYVAIDGGMSDNIRPALYQAKYEAVLANRVYDEKEEIVAIAGKCCESGDMLIFDLPLPKANVDDVLAVFCTGAYGYSMANNYNRIPRAAVVFVENGDHHLVVQRETFAQIVQNDLPYKVTNRSVQAK